MNKNSHRPLSSMDAFSKAVVAHISESSDHLPREVTERLRVARLQALAKRKPETHAAAAVAAFQNGSMELSANGHPGSFWSKFGSLLPLTVLLAGLVCIGWIQDDLRADELAAVDSELLLDELPPAAYVDPGFAQFLKRDQGN